MGKSVTVCLSGEARAAAVALLQRAAGCERRPAAIVGYALVLLKSATKPLVADGVGQQGREAGHERAGGHRALEVFDGREPRLRTVGCAGGSTAEAGLQRVEKVGVGCQ